MCSFVKDISRLINSGQSRSIVLSGNIDDLFFDGTNYIPLMNFLSKKYMIKPENDHRGIVQVLYEVNKKIQIVGEGEQTIRAAWNSLKPNENLDDLIEKSFTNPTLAMEILRQLTIISREYMKKSNYDLIVIIERAELILPQVEISRMNYADRKRCAIVHDWFSDPDFCNSSDSVILITESRSQLHHLISKLPQVLEIEIPYPNTDARKAFIQHTKPDVLNTNPYLPAQTAGLSIHALRQLLCEDEVDTNAVNLKVEEYICAQLGSDVIEFKRPEHHLKDVIGFTQIKEFITHEMIPRFMANDDSALVGAAVAGPIGGGKTYIMEALAAELHMPVLVLKNLRSQWYGQTDVIFERLKRTLTALDKVMIFIDEADTQFGGVDSNAHETERRLTGKIQAMMSDTKLRGKVIWLLMTARIELLSPDIRRPGRAGDLIIPILDPEGQDRKEFLKWVLGPIWKVNFESEDSWNCANSMNRSCFQKLDQVTTGYSSASFAALRSMVKAKKCNSLEEVVELAEEILPSDIESTRRYQTLQALLNCTRKSLLPLQQGKTVTQLRQEWRQELDSRKF
jgi:hypothetical protein